MDGINGFVLTASVIFMASVTDWAQVLMQRLVLRADNSFSTIRLILLQMVKGLNSQVPRMRMVHSLR